MYSIYLSLFCSLALYRRSIVRALSFALALKTCA